MIAELVERHGFPTDKTTVHSYGEFYDAALEPYRGRPIRLLEIGVDRGGSLRLWDAYFEGWADIIGIDVNPSAMATGAEWIADVIVADAYTEDMADSLGGFDVIIDDGPHTLDSMLKLIRLYAPRLRPGGLMVIEDVQALTWFAPLIEAVPSGWDMMIRDLRAVKNRYDDMLFAIRRPE